MTGLPVKRTVAVSAFWLRSMDGKAQMLAEINGRWFLVWEESLDPPFSAICESRGADRWKAID